MRARHPSTEISQPCSLHCLNPLDENPPAQSFLGLTPPLSRPAFSRCLPAFPVFSVDCLLSGVRRRVVYGWGQHEHHLGIHERADGRPRVRPRGVRPELLHRRRAAESRLVDAPLPAYPRYTLVLGRGRCQSICCVAPHERPKFCPTPRFSPLARGISPSTDRGRALEIG